MQKFILPLTLFSGTLGAGTVTFLSQEEKNHKNTNNLTIYKKGNNGIIIIGNSEEEKLKDKQEELRIISLRDGNWSQAELDKQNKKNTFWLMGKSKGRSWFSTIVPWITLLWTDDYQGKNKKIIEWKEMTKAENTQINNTSRQSTSISLRGISCEKLLNLLRQKESISKHFQVKNQSSSQEQESLREYEQTTISVKCEDNTWRFNFY